MSATTTERRESKGIVGDALRRPIQKAVKEGVREAMREEEARRKQSDRSSRSGGSSESDEGGGGRSKFGMLALLGIGVAAFMLWRRRSGGSGDGITESIREQSKTGGSSHSDSSGSSGSGGSGSGSSEGSSSGSSGSSGSGSSSSGSGGGGAVENTEQSIEAEDATPEASSE